MIPPMTAKKTRAASRTAQSAPPQIPPGGAPKRVSLQEIYGDPMLIDEDELLAKQDDIDFEEPLPVVMIDPVEAVKKLTDADGDALESLMKRPGSMSALKRHREAVRRGEWIGFPIVRRMKRRKPLTLDGYHRLFAMAIEGVRKAYAIDATTSDVPGQPGEGFALDG